MRLGRPALPRSPLVRLGILVAGLVCVGLLLWLRGPNWGRVGDAFTYVRWEWVAAAVGLNLLSIVVRSVAWRTVIDAALPPPRPSHLLVFSAFCVGLLANVVLPGRVGELARVWVLVNRLPRRAGTWATLVGTVVAHRIFDLVPSLLLVIFVLATARRPAWARTSLPAVIGIGLVLMVLAVLAARRGRGPLDDAGRLRRLVLRARQGLAVLRTPAAAAQAVLFQCLGWLCQFFAVYTAALAFGLHVPIYAAGLVLVLMNVATVLPLWPGNVGLVQAAIAVPLQRYYHVPYSRGIAFGIGLQAIEASVGIGIGLAFLTREGLTFATLRGMSEDPEPDDGEVAPRAPADARARASRAS
jgi:uncharacterized membrane protein YbhN (UPF0104 family)